MDLDIRQSGTICCLKLKGPLKYGEGVKQLDEAVEGALTSGHIHLLLDLSAMPYIDSSGIGAVVDALRDSKDNRSRGAETFLVWTRVMAERASGNGVGGLGARAAEPARNVSKFRSRANRVGDPAVRPRVRAIARGL